MKMTNLTKCNCKENCQDLKFTISQFTHRIEAEEECLNQIKAFNEKLLGTDFRFYRDFSKPYSLQMMLAERAK